MLALGDRLGKITRLRTLKKRLRELDKQPLSVSDKQDILWAARHYTATNSSHGTLLSIKVSELALEAAPQDVYSAADLGKWLVHAAQLSRRSQKAIADISKRMPKGFTESQKGAFMNMAYQTAKQGSLSEAILAARYFEVRLQTDPFDIEASTELEKWNMVIEKRGEGIIL